MPPFTLIVPSPEFMVYTFDICSVLTFAQDKTELFPSPPIDTGPQIDTRLAILLACVPPNDN